MNTFLMFGTFSTETLKKMTTAPTAEVQDLVTKNGGEMVSAYMLLGEKDVLLIVKFPRIEDVLKTSLALSKLMGATFSSIPAVSVEQFDQIIS